VDIPRIIELYNEFYMKDRNDKVKSKYHEQVPPEGRAKRCTRCGKCEELCPQHLPIRETVGRAAFIFEQEA
jgi:predicted aldo/keto reductase-like oxidoreductase